VEILGDRLEGKKSSNEGNYTFSYCWKNLECELCKGQLPGNHPKSHYLDEILCQGKKMYLIDYKRPKNSHFIILESVSSSTTKAIHVIAMT
jgi:hypothetical protein